MNRSTLPRYRFFLAAARSLKAKSFCSSPIIVRFIIRTYTIRFERFAGAAERTTDDDEYCEHSHEVVYSLFSSNNLFIRPAFCFEGHRRTRIGQNSEQGRRREVWKKESGMFEKCDLEFYGEYSTRMEIVRKSALSDRGQHTHTSSSPAVAVLQFLSLIILHVTTFSEDFRC